MVARNRRYEMSRVAQCAWLAERGWLRKPVASKATRERAIIAYQRFHALKPDGWAGPVTARSLKAPRFCSHPDEMTMRGGVCRWPQSDVTWAFDGSLPGVSAADHKDAFALAWSYWRDVCGLAPEYSGNPKTANVLMGAGRIDRSGQTLAWSELPCGVEAAAQLQQRYDTSEAWVIQEHPEPHRIDLVRVAAHEIGHAIGIPHIGGVNLMAPTYSDRIRRPQAGDIREADDKRYGPPIAGPVDEPPPGTTPAEMIDIQIRGQGLNVSIPGFRITKLR